MRSLGFLLGFFSIGAQVLLLRQITAAFGGSELLIGIALFGWLLSVAAGAWWGGRLKRTAGPLVLFPLGAALLPLSLAFVRLSPLWVVTTPPETVPFATAAGIACIAALPLGFLSGWLFPALARRGWQPAGAMVEVYLFEGLGAFAGGTAVTLTVGPWMSTLGAALAVSVVTVAFAFFVRYRHRLVAALVTIAATIAALVAAATVAPDLDLWLQRIRFEPFHVAVAFDTHYTRQTLLQHDSLTVLVTDSRVEAVRPDPAAAEAALLPGLLHRPEARRLLLLGRAEFGLGSLAPEFPQLHITAIDPRRLVTSPIERYADAGGVFRIETDPARRFRKRPGSEPYDLAVMAGLSARSYGGVRHLSTEFLQLLRFRLSPRGMLLVPTEYDTDRYVSDETRALLAHIRACLTEAFPYVWLWPGETTLLLASADSTLVDLPLETLVANLGKLDYEPRYLDRYRLEDRLQPFKRDRLQAALAAADVPQSDPILRLPHLQAAYDAKRLGGALWPSQLARSPWGALLVLIPALALFLSGLIGRGRDRRFGLFLFFVAGLVSIALELLVFFDFQMRSGALYTDMAVLIGTFMLGLALGAFVSRHTPGLRLERSSPALLLAAVAAFLVTHGRVGSDGLLVYYLLFLLVVAVGTGSLFVAATARYCGSSFLVNRGAGYAWEVLGSSLGALLTLTVLLPVLGLPGCLIALLAVLTAALAGSFLIGE